MNNLIWLRNDLRINDNPALYHGIKNAKNALIIYIYDDTNPQKWQLGGAKKWWLHHALQDLSKKVNLTLLKGDPLKIIPNLVKQHNIDNIYWNRRYEPWGIEVDSNIKQNLPVNSYKANLLFEPWEIKNKAGSYFKVFTPFWRKCLEEQGNIFDPLPKPELNSIKYINHKSEHLDSWQLLPTKPDWAGGMRKKWLVTEDAAHQQLTNFIQKISDYKEKRNFLDIDATSNLSPYLAAGQISPLQIWHKVNQSGIKDAGSVCFLSEVGWREFSYNLLYNYPTLPEQNFKLQFDKFPWQSNDKDIKAWQKGQTGYPIIDAAMQELWQTGIMHNRARMIVASFLTKHLLQDWRAGQDWFWDCLVDADLASNSASWQWVAGSGADAAPYFRIFNPITQGERFDKKGEYIKKWLPVLSNLPDKYIHTPWQAPGLLLAEAGITLGKNYPYPVIDANEGRNRALQAYKETSN